MPLYKLTVFSKNTDANQVLKGYEYQKLRTLENWLSNKVNKVDEVIYCDYEDDIFQRNVKEGTSKFTQIKLYSSKAFSFKSEEITKAIANFFMLYAKGEYSFDDVEFVFETNTPIAAKYGDNDAELLKSWNEHQTNLDADLIKECAEKVKQIVTKYISEEYPKAVKDDKSGAQSAVVDFNNLPEKVWEDFARCIKWQFTEESADAAIERTINNIKAHIKELPFPSTGSKPDTVFTTLYYEVSERLFQDEPENRCLTNQRMDSLILDLGDEADKQYNSVFNSWQGISQIQYFKLAEFAEVLHAANHCRHYQYLKDHTGHWQGLLMQYINLPETPERYCQNAIYEYLWLLVRPEWLKKPEGTLKGNEALIEQYFASMHKFPDHEMVENNLSLLQVVMACIAMGKCEIEPKKINQWLTEIKSIIDAQLAAAINTNEKCYWFELKANFLGNPLQFGEDGMKKEEINACYEEIILLLPHAPLYNVTRLTDRANQFIKIFLQLGDKNDGIEYLEKLVDRLMPFVSARNGKHDLAKVYVDRGIKYLKTTNPKHFAKALSYFHKAKDLWLQEETAEGYIIALQNISALYAGLNMYVAAKYYALSAAWFSINRNPEKLGKRISAAFGMIVHGDYKQGAWFNALETFKYYARSRIELDGAPVDTKDKMLRTTILDIVGLMTLMPKISSQYAGFVEYQKQIMDQTYNEFIEPLMPVMEEKVTGTGLQKFIQDNFSASPVNDIGQTRTIEWMAFGSTWKVSFTNTWLLNSLGEEFVAMLQILLVELSYSDVDLHLYKSLIEIEVLESDSFKTPEQLPSNHAFKWKFYTTKVDSADTLKIRMQAAGLITGIKYLLRDVSMLEDDKFFELVNSLFETSGLAEKAMTVNLYQRIYRGLFSEQAFIDSRRGDFTQELIQVPLKEDKIMEWNADLSKLYSSEDSIEHIKSRYKNMLRATHLTIDYLKAQPEFQQWYKELKEQKWLDWQIVMAIFNHVGSYKANMALKDTKFNSEEEYQKAFREILFKVTKPDEKENYLQLPFTYFQTPQFMFQLENTTHLVLHTWGLEYRAKYPNFPALRDFLNHRFNFGTDDVLDLTPFK